MMVLASRNLTTGRFEAFQVTDKTLVEQAQSALRSDLLQRDKNWQTGLGMSVNHVLVFRDQNGDAELYTILGDHFIVLDNVRYPSRHTITVIRAARDEGKAVAISNESARSLVPELSRYLD